MSSSCQPPRRLRCRRRASAAAAKPRDGTIEQARPPATRKILIAGGNFNTPFIRYMAELTGKPRPRLLYLPTASADSPQGIIAWYRNCSPLNVEAVAPDQLHRQHAAAAQLGGGLPVGGRHRLLGRQHAQPAGDLEGPGHRRDPARRPGIAASCSAAPAPARCAGSRKARPTRGPRSCRSCKCLGLLKGSHSPHYDAEPGRRPLYQKTILAGQMKPGYACDNDAGIYFEDNAVKRVVVDARRRPRSTT